MERVNRILNCSQYQEYLAKNGKAEEGRQFCRHDMGHFLDVARIALILNLEEGYGQEKEIIYAAALVHDIGRWQQYEDGTPHEKASAKLAKDILTECGFTEEESAGILKAVENHRNVLVREESSLSGLLYRADKYSRPCYTCMMEKECDWKKDKKNRELCF